MNLDDFSYEENDRRYIDPNVSLNEQNAFIQNLRDMQGKYNTQIARQTHNLGKDVPSHYGGLNGSEAYFNARFQTPQTNSLIGNLKSVAQEKALDLALNNELQKKQKEYNDAYYAARDRERNNSGNSNGLTSDDVVSELIEKLNIQTNGGNSNGNGNGDNNGNNNTGDGISQNNEGANTQSQPNTYTDNSGNVWVKNQINAAERITLPFMSNLYPKQESGTIINYNGRQYLYLDEPGIGGVWYRITASGE